MNFKLNLGFNQRLSISQRMRQSLNILSLSQEDLAQAIQNELLENPLLEGTDRMDSMVTEKESSEIPHFRMFDSLEASYGKEKKSLAPSLTEENLQEPLSLREHILKQIESSFYPKKIKLVMTFLVSYLDNKAFLPADIIESAQTENIPASLIQQALEALQGLEPAGIGGRNFKECLLIQLRHRKKPSSHAKQIIEHHLHHIREKKYRLIAFDLGISLKKTLELCQLIQSLDPYPTRNFSSQPTVFVQPDLHIYKMGENYHVLLNKDQLPELKFSRKYIQLIENRGNLTPHEKRYLNEKAIDGQWFLHAIQQRQDKIKKIAYYLIQHQRDFFDKGPSHIKSLKMADLAEELNYHISTISRTVNNKYVSTPYGLFSLKSFFQKGLLTKEGDSVPFIKIKNSIKRWVEEENPQSPLSDRDISDKIFEVFHIRLLRRSIGNYRSNMNIPSARYRKMNSRSLKDKL